MGTPLPPNHPQVGAHQRAHWLTELWSIALYMKLNAEKSHALGQVDLCVQGHALSKITEAKILGDVLNFKRDNWESLPMDRDRIATFCGRLARIARLPGSKENRLEAIGTSAIPVLFGGEFTPLDPKQGNDLRRKVWASARGGTKLPWTTAIEILMTTFSKGHRTDPIQAQAYTSVMSFARLHRLDADTVNDLAFIWQQMRDNGCVPSTVQRPGFGRSLRLFIGTGRAQLPCNCRI